MFLWPDYEVLSIFYVYIQMFFYLLSAAVCDSTATMCSVSDFILVEGKFSGQAGYGWTELPSSEMPMYVATCYTSVPFTMPVKYP